MAEKTSKYRTEIQQVCCSTLTPLCSSLTRKTQMMFVSGETAEPAPETTSLIEGIVQQQVIEMVVLRSLHDRFC